MSTAPPKEAPKDATAAPRRLMPVLLTGVFMAALDTAVIAPAIPVLRESFGLRIPDQLEERHHLTRQIPENARPVIFRSMMEHHSNDIAWRETIGDSVYVDFDAAGRISVEDLDAKLEKWKHRPWKIGTCLLYTSDAADERSSVDLGGRRIIKKKITH
mgnify:CR=1 FL=1